MKQQIQRVGIIHGTGGSSAIHWQTWLSRKCERLGLEAIYPKLPNNNRPTLSAWLEALTRAMPVIDETTALVAHSMGCPTILQLLRARVEIVKAGLVVLVAPSSQSRAVAIQPHLLQFYEGLTDAAIGSLRQKIGSSTVFAADNDRVVCPVDAERIARLLGSDFRLIPGGGHLNVTAGYHTFPEVLSLVTSSAMLR